MNDVGPIGKPQAATAVRQGRRAEPAGHAATPNRASDRAEFSQAARLLSKLAELPEVRQDLIDRVRAELEAGTYETPERIDATVDKVADDLA